MLRTCPKLVKNNKFKKQATNCEDTFLGGSVGDHFPTFAQRTCVDV